LPPQIVKTKNLFAPDKRESRNYYSSHLRPQYTKYPSKHTLPTSHSKKEKPAPKKSPPNTKGNPLNLKASYSHKKCKGPGHPKSESPLQIKRLALLKKKCLNSKKTSSCELLGHPGPKINATLSPNPKNKL
jgi:hypothetical protein